MSDKLLAGLKTMKTSLLTFLGLVILTAGCKHSAPVVVSTSFPPVRLPAPNWIIPMDEIPKGGGDVMLQIVDYPKGQTPNAIKVIQADSNIRNIRFVKRSVPNSFALRAFIKPRDFGTPLVEFTTRDGLNDTSYRVLATYPGRRADCVKVIDLGRINGLLESKIRSLPVPAGLPYGVITSSGGLACFASFYEKHTGEFCAGWGPTVKDQFEAYQATRPVQGENGSVGSSIPSGKIFGALYVRERFNGELVSDYVAKAYVEGPISVKPERPIITKRMLTKPGWQTLATVKYRSGIGKLPKILTCSGPERRFRLIKDGEGFLLQACAKRLSLEPSFLITLGLDKKWDHNLWVDVEGRTNPDAVLETP